MISRSMVENDQGCFERPRESGENRIENFNSMEKEEEKF